MFNDSIYNNVAHGLYGTAEDATPEDEKRKLVEEACIHANADSFIRKLPNGYDTRVGVRGYVLLVWRGGEKRVVGAIRFFARACGGTHMPLTGDRPVLGSYVSGTTPRSIIGERRSLVMECFGASGER